MNIGDRRGFEALVDIGWDVGCQQVFGLLHEDARNIECDVSVADHCNLARVEWPFTRKVWVGVIPVDEVGGTVGTIQVDARNVQRCVADRAGGKNHRVVMLLEVVEGDVFAILHVSEESNVSAVEHFIKCTDDSFDARMVGGNAISHQTIGCRQQIEQVD